MQVGHEYVGEIVEMGQEVRGFKVGDRVSGEGPHHLRILPQLPRRAPAPVPQHRRSRRQSRGRVSRSFS
jgi:NADPH:quinone reductase-like Zn-dependent oxidoreductase